MSIWDSICRAADAWNRHDTPSALALGGLREPADRGSAEGISSVILAFAAAWNADRLDEAQSLFLPTAEFIDALVPQGIPGSAVSAHLQVVRRVRGYRGLQFAEPYLRGETEAWVEWEMQTSLGDPVRGAAYFLMEGARFRTAKFFFNPSRVGFSGFRA